MREEDIPDIVARSLSEANQTLPELGSDVAVVSIGEPDTSAPPGVAPDRPSHVRLEFHDVVDPEIGTVAGRTITPPSRNVVAKLLERRTTLRAASLVYCHCNAGISRAPAAAFVLRCAWSPETDERRHLSAVVEDRPRASPNRLFVEYADELLERDGALLGALDDLESPARR